MSSKLVLASSPHLHGKDTTRSIMRDVIIALMPALVAAVWMFGVRTLAVTVVCVGSCVASEYLSRLILKREQTVGDLSCIVTGLLLAFNLPVSIPLWEAAFGGVVAIVVVKQMFGGIGCNFVNPALMGRIVLLGSFASDMNAWALPRGVDAVSSATPLAAMANGEPIAYTLTDMFLGRRPGSLGETCVLALLIGFVYLLVRRVITPVIPVVYIGTVFVLSWLIEGSARLALYQILSGGLFLGAIFMATDYTTTPVTRGGHLLFGLGCGLLTVLIRQYGSLPEGVSFAIVLMNIVTPYLDRLTMPRVFGQQRAKKEAAK